MTDTSSPGFVIQVLARAPEIRLGSFGKPPTSYLSRPGVVLARMTDASMRVEKFEYVDGERDFGRLRLTVDNWDNYFFEHPAWVPGNLVRFFWGYPGKIQGPKYAIIDSVRGFQRLEVSCMEQAALSNQAKTFLWENTTRAGIVAQLVRDRSFPGVTKMQLASGRAVDAFQAGASTLGLGIDPDLASVFESLLFEKPRAFQQDQQTDWQFIHRLAAEIGFEVFVEDDVFHFHPRLLDRRPVREYEWFTGSGDLLDFKIDEWRVLDRAAVVEVSGRDPISMLNLFATGSNTTTKRHTLGREGTSAMETSLRPNTVDGTLLLGKRKISTPRSDAATVENIADSQFRDLEQGEVEASATTIGDPVLKKARLVRIVGISRVLSGNFYVDKVTHRIDHGGYRCDLKLIRNALTALPTTNAPFLDPNATKTNDAAPASGRKITSNQVGDLKAQ